MIPGRKWRITAITACMLAGCSGAVEIPREQFEAASHDTSTSHRIRTKEGSEYVAAQFSLTDSTVVIGRLSQADYLYTSRRVPITVARQDVVSIAAVQSNELVPVIVVGSVMALAAVLVT